MVNLEDVDRMLRRRRQESLELTLGLNDIPKSELDLFDERSLHTTNLLFDFLTIKNNLLTLEEWKEFEGGKSRLFGNIGARKSLRRAYSMAVYARDDIMEVAGIETDIYSEVTPGDIETFKRTYDDPFYPDNKTFFLSEMERQLDKTVHNFIGEISTLVDNVYQVVASYYGIDTFSRDAKKSVIRILRDRENRELAEHLSTAFRDSLPFRNFNNLRNYSLHACPTHNIRFPDTQAYGDVDFFSLAPTISYPTSSGSKEGTTEGLYDFMLGLYSHVLDSTKRALYLMLGVNEELKLQYPIAGPLKIEE